jgi:hypothetical protein
MARARKHTEEEMLDQSSPVAEMAVATDPNDVLARVTATRQEVPTLSQTFPPSMAPGRATSRASRSARTSPTRSGQGKQTSRRNAEALGESWPRLRDFAAGVGSASAHAMTLQGISLPQSVGTL